jgi:hypothetical protein
MHAWQEVWLERGDDELVMRAQLAALFPVSSSVSHSESEARTIDGRRFFCSVLNPEQGVLNLE